jgi:hypothetical protein
MQSYDVYSRSYTATTEFQCIIGRNDNRQCLSIFASSGDTEICFDDPLIYASFTILEGDNIEFIVPTNTAIYITGSGSTIVVCTNGFGGIVPPPPQRIYLRYNGIVTSYNSVQLFIEE